MKTDCYELIAKDEEKVFAEQFLFLLYFSFLTRTCAFRVLKSSELAHKMTLLCVPASEVLTL